MRSALAQLLRLLLQWVESNSDERDIVTQVHETWQTKRLIRADKFSADSPSSRTASKRGVIR
jgi:hypothetical protein